MHHQEEPDQWYSYTPCPASRVTRQRRQSFHNPTPCPAPGGLLQPTSVTTKPTYASSVPGPAVPDRILFHQQCSVCDMSNIPSPFHDTPTFFQCLIGVNPPTIRQCEDIVEELQFKSLLACSDGSHCSSTKKASHSWVFASEVRRDFAKGAGPDDSLPLLMSSFRSEL